MRGNRSELAPKQMLSRCHVNIPLVPQGELLNVNNFHCITLALFGGGGLNYFAGNMINCPQLSPTRFT